MLMFLWKNALVRSFLTLALLMLAGPGRTPAAMAAPTDGAAGIYDVRAFGAVGDGAAADTAAINKAIDAAAAAGGGTVRFGAGTYLSGSVHLKSNVTLDIGPGATLVAGTPGPGIVYDAPEPNPTAGAYQDFGHTHFHNSLIWGENLHDIGIVGQGRILGTALVRSDARPDGLGNKSISLKLCRNVTLRDITIQHGGWFGILATGVDNFTIDNMKFDTNRDGMDIDCCRNVHISNCDVNSPRDDGICLKSSFGLGFARATENVTITNCSVSGFDEGTFLDGTYQRRDPTNRAPTGRIKFGTESNGGFKNITISNCTFDNCRGLALETVDGALLEDVVITNITMRDIVNSPIFLRLGSRMRGPAGVPVGHLRRVSISHVNVYNASADTCSIISGIPGHPIEDVSLSDINLWYSGGGTQAQAAITPPELEAGYPEPGSLGPMPAYALFLRHVSGITLDHIQTHFLADDQRPPIVMNDVVNADFQSVKAQRASGVSLLGLNNVTNLRLHQVDGTPDAQKDQTGPGSL